MYIFNINNALLYFEPETFLRTLWKDGERASRLHQEVFQSAEWRLLEEGSIVWEDAAEWLCHRHPRDAEHIRFVLKYWLRCLTPRWETVELLLDMKAQGLRLFFLCQTSTAGRDYILSTYPFMSLFEGGLFSCDAKVNLNDIQVYQSLCAKYRLEGGGCVYIGNGPGDIKAAEAHGMRAVRFVSAERVRDGILW